MGDAKQNIPEDGKSKLFMHKLQELFYTTDIRKMATENPAESVARFFTSIAPALLKSKSQLYVALF